MAYWEGGGAVGGWTKMGRDPQFSPLISDACSQSDDLHSGTFVAPSVRASGTKGNQTPPLGLIIKGKGA